MSAQHTRRQFLAATAGGFAVTPRSSAAPAKSMRGAIPIMAHP